MGLNLDIDHVAFAGLSKFDGQRQRRLTTSEMAQIAGRAGRHQRDGTFGTLAGSGSHDAEFTAEEVYAIEEHRFPPLTKLFWREAEPDCSSLAALIADLSRPPEREGLAPAPEAIDLAVLRRLSEDSDIAASIRGEALVRRFREVCALPDFRQHGAETHSRFVARLWEDLRHGQLGGDYVARAIAELNNPSGDIDTLQMRIAAIRTWSYVAQRPDWVLAKEEMAARARAVETRLSDALHGRLTERFVNRRTSVLMKKLGPDAALLPVKLAGDEVLVDGEAIGHLAGFRFRVDPQVRLADRKLLLAAAERHLPKLRSERAEALLGELAAGPSALTLNGPQLAWDGEPIARLEAGRGVLSPRIALDSALDGLAVDLRKQLLAALEGWLELALTALTPLRRIEEAALAEAAGPELRALLIRLTEAGGLLERAGSGLERLTPEQRDRLRKLGVRVGALDLFVPEMLKPAALTAWRTLLTARGSALPTPVPGMPPVVATPSKALTPPGYRSLGKQALRLDVAEKLLRAAHDARVTANGKPFVLDPALAVSTGLATASFAQLLRLAGFSASVPRAMPDGAFGPPKPPHWRWRPIRREEAVTLAPPPPAPGSAFAALAGLVR